MNVRICGYIMYLAQIKFINVPSAAKYPLPPKVVDFT